MSRPRLLVTGAGGFTGRHAVRHFAEAGHHVTAVVRREPPPGGFPSGVETAVCDLSSRAETKALVEASAPDAVLHLAGRNSVPESWRDPLLYMESNIMSVLYILDALRGRPSVRVLVAGSRLKFRPELGETPPHPYSLSKTLETQMSLAWGSLFAQQVLLAEPCNLIGPGPSTGFCSLLARHIAACEAGAAQAPFRLSSRTAKRDFLDVRDAVQAYADILERGEALTVYRIDSGCERPLGDIADSLLARTAASVPMAWGDGDGRDAAPPVAPPAVHPTAVQPAEAAASGTGTVIPAAEPSAVTPAASSPAPSSRSAYREADVTELGWAPSIPFEVSLNDILDDCRKA